MEKELFEKLFKKLKTEPYNNTESVNGCAEYFKNHIIPQKRFNKYGNVVNVSSRTIVNYYNKFVEGNPAKTGDPHKNLISLIEEYLDEEESLSTLQYLYAFIGVITILIFSSYIYQNNYAVDSNCIIWKEDHYEKSSCFNLKALNNNKYNINIERFKKIQTTDSTRFFINGDPIVWYGENKKGKKEYFTYRGLHPETLKELKLVTRIILKKDGKLNE